MENSFYHRLCWRRPATQSAFPYSASASTNSVCVRKQLFPGICQLSPGWLPELCCTSCPRVLPWGVHQQPDVPGLQPTRWSKPQAHVSGSAAPILHLHCEQRSLRRVWCHLIQGRRHSDKPPLSAFPAGQPVYLGPTHCARELLVNHTERIPPGLHGSYDLLKANSLCRPGGADRNHRRQGAAIVLCPPVGWQSLQRRGGYWIQPRPEWI